MSDSGGRAPLLVIAWAAHQGSPMELVLMGADAVVDPLGTYDWPGGEEDLAGIVTQVVTAGKAFEDVVVDLSAVQWIDSTGLGWLVGLARQSKQRGDRVALVGVNERITKLLKVTSLDLVLPRYESRGEAVVALR